MKLENEYKKRVLRYYNAWKNPKLKPTVLLLYGEEFDKVANKMLDSGEESDILLEELWNVILTLGPQCCGALSAPNDCRSD